MKFSYSAIWADCMALLRAHGTLVATVAGVFLFLPGLLVAYFLPQPQTKDITRLAELWLEYLGVNWPWLLLSNLIGMVGAAAILLLVFRRGITVGGAIAAAFALLPFYFLLSVLCTLILCLGFVLLVVPGFYLLGRLAPASAVLVAENRRNPVDAIARAFALTRGRGWAAAGLIVLVAVAATIVIWVAIWLFGILAALILGRDLAVLLALIVGAAGNAALTTLFILLFASVYRALAGPGSAAAAE